MDNPTPGDIRFVRVEAIGDFDDTDTLSDETVAYFWQSAAGAGDVLLTAALCCDALANQAARHFAWSADGQSLHMNDRVKQYRDAAAALRQRAYGSGAITVALSGVTADEFA